MYAFDTDPPVPLDFSADQLERQIAASRADDAWQRDAEAAEADDRQAFRADVLLAVVGTAAILGAFILALAGLGDLVATVLADAPLPIERPVNP